jgi:hypothetical protein
LGSGTNDAALADGRLFTDPHGWMNESGSVMAGAGPPFDYSGSNRGIPYADNKLCGPARIEPLVFGAQVPDTPSVQSTSVGFAQVGIDNPDEFEKRFDSGAIDRNDYVKRFTPKPAGTNNNQWCSH